MLDCEIAHIKRLAERKKADDQEPVGLACAGQKELRWHGARQYAATTHVRTTGVDGAGCRDTDAHLNSFWSCDGGGAAFAAGFDPGLDGGFGAVAGLCSGAMSASARRWPSKATGWQ